MLQALALTKYLCNRYDKNILGIHIANNNSIYIGIDIASNQDSSKPSSSNLLCCRGMRTTTVTNKRASARIVPTLFAGFDTLAYFLRSSALAHQI